MPITYTVHPDQRLVKTTVEGVVTADDLRIHAQRMASDTTRIGALYELVDLSRVEPGPVPTQAIRDMARYLFEKDANTPGARLALVASSDAAFGVARMFEAYREHPDFKIRVFRRLGDAEQWLGVGDPA